MPASIDGATTPRFTPVTFRGVRGRRRVRLDELTAADVGAEAAAIAAHAPSGDCVGWGIPFKIGKVLLVDAKPITVKVQPFSARWVVFQHVSAPRPLPVNADGFTSPTRGRGRLGEHAADYVACYADGSERRVAIRRRHELGAVSRGWGENCFEAVPHHKPYPIRAGHEQMRADWGISQTRAIDADRGPWTNWLFAWRNPQPGKAIVALRFEPVSGTVLIVAIAQGNCSTTPLRWESRRKAVLTLPRGVEFDPDLDAVGQLPQIGLDMGQVISATPRTLYPNQSWAKTYNNRLPEVSERELIVEYAAHPDACFHLRTGKTTKVVPVASLKTPSKRSALRPIAPALQRVALRVVEKDSRKPVPVKLHAHGQADEYLPPLDRHRLPNPAWFEDYSPDFLHGGTHWCSYITGETELRLPLGRVYLEISKGFEIRPIRKVVKITRATERIEIEIEKVLPWREQGWVSADTHVHFLSPQTALLEGSGEGVNVVNLLASQWGELMTNVGDFDGKTTIGSKQAGGDGEFLVRVGTENRQHILGHISLLGYQGNIIAPMTTGGANESAIGDPIEVLMTEWARQCKRQKGLVVLPHSPNPRAEGAATIVSGDVDAVEMTSWGDLYSGIDPYSLSDWYRYLNCGYFVAAAGGTDKMAASTPVGAVRTYARIKPGRGFTYAAWMDAVRRGDTFVTYGPLLDFAVAGQAPGAMLKLPANGGTVDVTWHAASVTVPMSRVDLIVNGEIRESQAIALDKDQGHWSVKVDRSSWLALLLRGGYPDKREIIAAHSSPVMVRVGKGQFFAAADAETILEQIEGVQAFLETVGTRAEAKAYKRMRMVLTAAHRQLHNRMHQAGMYHQHTPTEDHREHH